MTPVPSPPVFQVAAHTLRPGRRVCAATWNTGGDGTGVIDYCGFTFYRCRRAAGRDHRLCRIACAPRRPPDSGPRTWPPAFILGDLRRELSHHRRYVCPDCPCPLRTACGDRDGISRWPSAAL